MNVKKAASLLGFAQKAGKVASGEFSTEDAVKKGKAYLVMIAGDASDNTKKKFENMCTFYEVPFVCLFSKEELGHQIGKEYRASLAILDPGFAESIQKALRSSDPTDGKGVM